MVLSPRCGYLMIFLAFRLLPTFCRDAAKHLTSKIVSTSPSHSISTSTFYFNFHLLVRYSLFNRVTFLQIPYFHRRELYENFLLALPQHPEGWRDLRYATTCYMIITL
jgi:hypothetical protein